MNNLKLLNFHIKKEVILTFFYILILLLLERIFPTGDVFQKIISSIVFLILLPLLYLKFILKKNLISWSRLIGDYRNGLMLMILSLLIAAIILSLICKYTNFINLYLIPKDVVNNFNIFLIYELVAVLFVVICYEVFFRWFIVLYFSEFFGYWAVLIQFLFFSFMALISASNRAFFVPYLIFTPLAGIITYKSRSIIYSVAGQLLIMIVFDAYFVKMIIK